jgi:Tfp pilus assembly protein PilZ
MFRRSEVTGEVLKMDRNADSVGEFTDEKEVLPMQEELGDEAFNANECIRETVDFGDDKDLHGDTKNQQICRRAPAIISAGFASYDGSYAGTILNISETGAFIRYDQDLKPLDYINVRLSLPEEKRVMEVKSKVIWAKRFDEKENLYQGMGVHFASITPEDRASIASFVNKALHKDEQTNKEQEEGCGGLTRNHPEENINEVLSISV